MFLRKLTRSSFPLVSKVTNGRLLFFSGLLSIGRMVLHVLLAFFLERTFQLLRFDRETHGLGSPRFSLQMVPNLSVNCKILKLPDNSGRNRAIIKKKNRVLDNERIATIWGDLSPIPTSFP